MPITVDINSSRPSGATRMPIVDYALSHTYMPHTRALSKIIKDHQIGVGMCLYGGRQAHELRLLRKRVPDFRFVVFAAGSDVLRPHARAGRPTTWVSRRLVSRSLQGAELVLANGRHIEREVSRLTRGEAAVHTWQQGIDIDEIPVHTAQGSESCVSVLAPRPWGSIYNNEEIVGGLREYALGEDAHELSVLFCGPWQSSEAPEQLVSTIGGSITVDLANGYAFERRFSLFATSDIVVSMALSDGTPNSVLEAAYAGSMLVLSDVPANRALVEDLGLHAELAGLGDADSFAAAIENTIGARDEWPAYAAVNRRAIAETLSTTVTQTSLCQHMDQVMIDGG